MPTRSDITVVNSAYDTSGNGGRKLVKLTNGWLVSVAKTTDNFYFYVSKDNGQTFQQLCWISGVNIDANDICITAVGTKVYAIHGNSTVQIESYRFDATTVSNQNIFGLAGYYTSLDTSQTALGNVSLIANDTGTELHAAWSSKNATYANSFNIRYAKGTINADGSVTWGTVMQITTYNTSGNDYKNPSIVVKNGNPIITMDEKVGTTNTISCYVYNGSTFTYYTIYNGSTYAQSSPSAIFVPQSINGLANGRIWVSWHGKDATDIDMMNIRVSYSDDGGVTWSAMQKLTSGNVANKQMPTLTANKSNKIFIQFENWDVQTTSAKIQVSKLSYDGTNWSSLANVTNITASNYTVQPRPSALFDLSLNYTEPLFIYANYQTSKVGFYGTWTITTISVPEGYLGTRTVKDIQNMLTYAITTDGTMSTVTEKVNDGVVGSGSVGNGVNTSVMMTNSQWDNVKYGKSYLSPYNLLGFDGDCEDTSRFTTSSNTTLTLDIAKKTKGTNGIKVSKANSLTGTLTPKNVILPTAVNDCYLAIADVYTNETTTSLYLSSSLNGVTVSAKQISPDTGGYPSTTGSFQPIMSAYKINSITQVGVSSFAPQIQHYYNSSSSYFVDNIRIYKITLAEYTAFTVNQSLSNVQAIVASYAPVVKDNTLTVEMGTDKWTYTFDKRLADDVTMEEATKADQDVANTFLPVVKTKLANAINSKGGTAKGDDSFDALVSGISGLGGMRSLTGTVTSSASASTFTYVSGTTSTSQSITVTGLPFKPTFIYVFYNSSGLINTSIYNELSGDLYPKTIKVTQGYNSAGNGTASTYHFKGDVAPASVVNGTFTLPVITASATHTWIAFG